MGLLDKNPLFSALNLAFHLPSDSGTFRSPFVERYDVDGEVLKSCLHLLILLLSGSAGSAFKSPSRWRNVPAVDLTWLPFELGGTLLVGLGRRVPGQSMKMIRPTSGILCTISRIPQFQI